MIAWIEAESFRILNNGKLFFLLTQILLVTKINGFIIK
jgi:hypothetical protein